MAVGIIIEEFANSVDVLSFESEALTLTPSPSLSFDHPYHSTKKIVGVWGEILGQNVLVLTHKRAIRVIFEHPSEFGALQFMACLEKPSK